jgi:2-C-methyl-D-erythritol 4-phosphate cytidylyltransferase
VIAVVVAAPEIHVERTRRALARVTRRAPVTVVQGGGMRQDSVWLALRAVPGHADIIIVHDAVRPLITRGLIDAVVRAVADSGAAICALPITETIKRVRQDVVETTLDRSELWAVQTPRPSRRLLREAHEKAPRDGVVVDDAMGRAARSPGARGAGARREREDHDARRPAPGAPAWAR